MRTADLSEHDPVFIRRPYDGGQVYGNVVSTRPGYVTVLVLDGYNKGNEEEFRADRVICKRERFDPAPMQNEALPQARYAGYWSRFDCEACGEEFEIEGDCASGEVVRCDACGADCEVYGR